MPLRLLLLLAAAAIAFGQIDIFDLATTGDGGAAYFVSTLTLKGEAQPVSPHWRIFRIDPEGFRFYWEPRGIDPPPSAGPREPRFTSYFQLSGPQTSRDGRVVAFVGRRLCSGSPQCASATALQTTVTGLPGGDKEVTGGGLLSGNGRYLLIHSDGSLAPRCVYVVDLQSGEEMRTERCVPAGVWWATGGEGRRIADDGTAVVTAGYLYLIRSRELSRIDTLSGSPGRAVIDSAGRMVVYDSSRGSLRIYRIPEQRDSLLAALPGGAAQNLYLSADGRRVMFVSNVSGLPQIHIVQTDGGQPRQVTREESGVLSAVMSDDGKTAWFFSGTARLYRLDLDTGQAHERLGRTPQLGGPITRMAAGSVYSIPGAGLSDRRFTAGEYPLPRSLSGVSVLVNGVIAPLIAVSPGEILLQIPSQTGGGTAVEVVAESSSPFVPRTQFGTSAFPAWSSFLFNPQSPSAYGSSDALAVRQDWSVLVTSANPASPGEIVHLYATGLGRVDSPPLDGMPARADPPARTLAPVTCWAWGADNATRLDIPVLFTGLAPGFAGVYQMDVRLPQSNVRPSIQLNCSGEGGDFLGSFAVRP
jgi:uncharacterized protein (TIGR03437 family)